MTSKETIRKRLEMLRGQMAKEGIRFALMKSTDPHASEYICDHYKVTEYFSGCTSDNVILITDAVNAYLWTDGRFFISAANELEDTGITLMREGMKGVPTVEAFLKRELQPEDVLAFDGRSMDASSGKRYRMAAEKAGATVNGNFDPAEELWIGRPKKPQNPVWILPGGLAGESADSRLARIRRRMEEEGARHHIVSSLDDIAWILNIRGSDIACCPVCLAYLLVGAETADLFIQKEEVNQETADYFREIKVKIHEYEDVFSYLENYHFEGSVWIDSGHSSFEMMRCISEKADVLDLPNPSLAMKARKNKTEIENSKYFYLLDSVAVSRFIYGIRNKIGRERITEYTAACEMDRLRREIPGFLDYSFGTISAYNVNAAMAHYQASEENASVVGCEGFLLVDSGGQYKGATTDVTRTIAVGPLSAEMKRDYTLTAAANLRLMYSRFKKGTTGSQLDLIARSPLYEYGIDYDHGTGHGIGYILNVHEGPQRIGKHTGNTKEVPMEAGMITSDEPGVYRENLYGIRIESILLCVEDCETEFGEFLRFDPLTFVPLEREAIDIRYLTEEDRILVNHYHAEVREKLAGFFTGDELKWLIEVTEEI